jgi:putative inorganic carbon (HCO3(-)) transporter
MNTSLDRSTSYLLQETILIIFLGYFLLIGGTLNGLVQFQLNVISTVLVAIIVAVWLGCRLYRRERLPGTGLGLPIIAFLGAQLIATALSSDPRRSLGNTWLIAFYALAFYLLVDLLRHGWPAELLVKSLLVVSGIVIALGLIEIGQWYADWFAVGGWAHPLPPVTLRVRAFLGHGNFAAGFLNLLIPLALTRFIWTRDRIPRLLLVLWLVAALVIVFFSSSRGGWLGTATALAITFSLLALISSPKSSLNSLGRWISSRWWLVIPLGCGLALMVAGMIWLGFRQLQHPSHGSILTARRDFWLTAWRAFQSSPLWGTGPFTYGTQYMKYNSVPPGWPFAHAHNYLFNLAAETGLIGLASAGWLIVAILRALGQSWQRASREHRLLMVGCAGSLAGCAAHNLADTILTMPTIVLTIVAVLAVALVDQSSPSSGKPHLRLSIAWLLLPSLLLIGAAFRANLAYKPFHQGVWAANTEDWASAAPLLDQAAQSDPHLAFYHLQSGYAHGMLAAAPTERGDLGSVPMFPSGENRLHLEQAIAQYEIGIALEPSYSLNHANLASLYWQAERQTEAIQQMETAIGLAPKASLYHLNLGFYYEELGQGKKATAEYHRALTLQSRLAQASWWQQSLIREQALMEWQEENPPPPLPTSPQAYNDYVRLGWHQLEQGHFEAAIRAFDQAQSQDPNRVEAYCGLGNVYLEEGDFEAAEYYLRAGLFFAQGGNVWTKLRTWFDWGELAHRQGQLDEAIARYEQALDMIRGTTAYGPGTLGISEYGWYIFYRESIMPDLLPQLVRIHVTNDLAQKYLELGQWYEEKGDTEKALDTYCELLAAVPDFAPAIERKQILVSRE